MRVFSSLLEIFKPGAFVSSLSLSDPTHGQRVTFSIHTLSLSQLQHIGVNTHVFPGCQPNGNKSQGLLRSSIVFIQSPHLLQYLLHLGDCPEGHCP
eukprot:sb/3479135/